MLRPLVSEKTADKIIGLAIYEAKKRLEEEKRVINTAHSVGWDEGHMYDIKGQVYEDYYDETFEQ